MQHALLNQDGEKTYAVIFETGDEVISGLTRFAREQGLAGSHFTAIGAFDHVVLAYFDWASRDYEKIPLEQQVEVLSLIGDIAMDGKEPKVHAHTVVGLRDGTTRGGHLMEGRVRPTLEVVLTESPRHLQRRHDDLSGLALIDLEAARNSPPERAV